MKQTNEEQTNEERTSEEQTSEEQTSNDVTSAELAKSEQSRAYAGTQLITRAFQLLKMFNDQQSEWQLNDLVAASGLKKTTVFRILTALEAEGMIQRTAQGAYALGVEVIALGGRAMRSNPLRKVAHPYLRRLVEQTMETATLETLWLDPAGLPATVVLDEALSPKLLGVTQYIGMQFPAHMTSTGKVILAHEPPKRVEQLLPERLPARTEQTITSRAELQTALVAVRQQGFATSCHELEIGIVAAAAPIFNHNGQIWAALSVSGPDSRISTERQQQELVPLVCRMATEISQKLGWQGKG